MKQRGGRINNPYGGREHGKEKIIKGYVIDAKTIRKILGAVQMDKLVDIDYIAKIENALRAAQALIDADWEFDQANSAANEHDKLVEALKEVDLLDA